MAFVLKRQERFNQDYRGHAERCTYTFTVNLPDQLGASWFADNHINAHIAELENQGSILLEYRLWEDKLSGTWTTDYKCEIVASASPVVWMVVIVGVLAILGLLVVAWSINKIEDIVEYIGPGATGAISVAVIAVAVVVLAAIINSRRG